MAISETGLLKLYGGASPKNQSVIIINMLKLLAKNLDDEERQRVFDDVLDNIFDEFFLAQENDVFGTEGVTVEDLLREDD